MDWLFVTLQNVDRNVDLLPMARPEVSFALSTIILISHFTHSTLCNIRRGFREHQHRSVDWSRYWRPSTSQRSTGKRHDEDTTERGTKRIHGASSACVSRPLKITKVLVVALLTGCQYTNLCKEFNFNIGVPSPSVVSVTNSMQMSVTRVKYACTTVFRYHNTRADSAILDSFSAQCSPGQVSRRCCFFCFNCAVHVLIGRR